MRDALIALAWAGLSFNLLVALCIGAGAAFAWYTDRKSTTERASTVDRVDGYRRRMEWEAQCKRAEWRMKQKAKQRARANLAQFHRRGGNDAA